MDKSWSFLIDAQRHESSALMQICKDSGFVVSSLDACSLLMGMGKELLLSSDYDYVHFIDKLGAVFSLNFQDKNLLEKETVILEHFLITIIGCLDENEVKCFAKNYRFSSVEREGLGKEIISRISVSQNFKLILPCIVFSLSKPKNVEITLISYGIRFAIMRPIYNSPVELVSVDLKDSSLSKWIPAVSLMIKMRQEYDRPFEINMANEYLDTIIRLDTSFQSQKYSILSVMLSLYKALHDKSKQSISLITEISKYLQSTQTSFCIQVLKRADQEQYLSLMRSLMERLFPCKEYEKRVFRINDHDNMGKGKTAYFYYKFPYSKPESFPNARYAIPDDEFEKEAAKLYLSCRDLNLNKHLIAKDILLKEIEQSVTDWTIVIAAWDDENNYPKGVTIIKNDPLFDSLIEKYQYSKKHTIRVPVYTIKLLTDFLRGFANVEDVETLLNSNLLGRAGYLEELLKTAMQMVSEKKNYERSSSELGIKFRNLRHHTSIKIGRIRLKLDAIAKNEYDAGDIETIKNKLSEIETMLQSAGKDEDELVEQLDLIDALNAQIQGWEDVFSVEKEYNNNEKLWIEFGKTEFSIVLDNIYKNIETHAFTKTIPKKAKRVKVSIENLNNGSINVSISNNGIPFEGDPENPEKVFDYGQTYGNSGNKGIGLPDVMELMRKHGGNAAFKPNSNEEFCVTVQLTFKGVNKKEIFE